MILRVVLGSVFLGTFVGWAANTVATIAGKSSFTAKTNVGVVTVQGKSNQLTAKCAVTKTGDAIEIADVEASVPVASISTGMGVRDRHMQERIFKTNDGKMPDLRFTSAHSQCSKSGGDYSCRVTGEFTLRGVSRPVEIALKVRDQQGAYRAQGSAMLKLSDFGIDPPSELGVKIQDGVEFRVEFTAEPRVTLAGGIR